MDHFFQAHLFEEGGVHTKVLGHHIQTEEVSVDAVARHSQSVEVLMLLGSPSEQLSAMLLLLWDHSTQWMGDFLPQNC